MSKNDRPVVETKNDSFYMYKWYVEFYNTEKTSESKIHPIFLESFTKSCDYKNANIPVLFAKMRLRIKDIIIMKEWQKNCLADIKCKSIEYKLNKKTNTYKEGRTKLAWSSTFVPIFDAKTFKSKYNKEEVFKRAEKKNGADIQSDQAYVDMVFINPTATSALKTMFCQVVAPGSNIGTIIQWLISELSIDGAIVDTPDNTSELNDIIIPPLSFVNAMHMLQSVYGIYENGLQIFYDTDKLLYVLDKYSLEHDIESGSSEVTTLFVLDAKEDSVGKISRLESGKDAKYVGVIPIVYDTNEVLDGEINGNTLVFSSFLQGIDSVKYKDQEVDSDSVKSVAVALTRNSKTNKLSGDKILAEYDELNNVYNMASYFNGIESQAQRLTVKISNCKPEDFKPNMFIDLQFEDITKNNEQGGIYFINSVEFTYSRSKTSEIMPTSSGDSEEKANDKYTPTKTICSCILKLSRKNPDTNEE